MNIKAHTYGILLVFLGLHALCFSQIPNAGDAQDIIDKSIEAHGGDAYDHLSVSFIFRTKAFTITLNKGQFEYTSSYSDSTGTYVDKLTNDGYIRTHNGKVVSLSEKYIKRYSNSLNSVAYFSLLPKGLNDPAVNKKFMGTTKIKGQDYQMIEVTFDEKGGGDDHDDTFAYWINEKTHTMDYLAYSYSVNGGGVRFREAFNPVVVGGVRFQNYINYKPSSLDTPLKSLPQLFEQDLLKKLSEIINEEVSLKH